MLIANDGDNFSLPFCYSKIQLRKGEKREKRLRINVWQSQKKYEANSFCGPKLNINFRVKPQLLRSLSNPQASSNETFSRPKVRATKILFLCEKPPASASIIWKAITKFIRGDKTQHRSNYL